MFYSIATGERRSSEGVFWKEVDEGWIRYEEHSGNTQLINPLARFIIDLIDRSVEPLSIPDIANEVLLAEPDTEPSTCLVEVVAVLRTLSEAQLILAVRP